MLQNFGAVWWNSLQGMTFEFVHVTSFCYIICEYTYGSLRQLSLSNSASPLQNIYLKLYHHI